MIELVWEQVIGNMHDTAEYMKNWTYRAHKVIIIGVIYVNRNKSAILIFFCHYWTCPRTGY